MKDTELVARLQSLGMSPSKAATVTRQLRDVIRPVAVAAALKVAQHQEALGRYAAYGDAGLAGYETDGISGLKKLVKGVGKVVKKVVAPVAAIVAAPMTGGASIAAYGAIKSAKIGRKSNKETIAAQKVMQTEAIAAQQAQVQAQAPAAAVESAAAEGKGRGRRTFAVKRSIDNTAGQVAAAAVSQGYPADPATLMSALMANQGSNMASPAAQSVVREVAAQGVEQTPAGPSALPSWALPAGAAALVLVLVLSRKGK